MIFLFLNLIINKIYLTNINKDNNVTLYISTSENKAIYSLRYALTEKDKINMKTIENYTTTEINKYFTKEIKNPVRGFYCYSLYNNNQIEFSRSIFYSEILKKFFFEENEQKIKEEEEKQILAKKHKKKEKKKKMKKKIYIISTLIILIAMIFIICIIK